MSIRRKRFEMVAMASREDPKLDHWDQMELKFGRLLGEDPKLTLAKIMGRKANPDVSYLDIEKSFHKNKGRLNDGIVEVPLDGIEDVGPSNSSYYSHSSQKSKIMGKNLNLVRPVMKGTKPDEPNSEPSIMTEPKSIQYSNKKDTEQSKSNVTLRKPSIMRANDVEIQKSPKMEIKPNLFLKMRNSLKENSSDTSAKEDNISNITLLKKPDQTPLTLKSNQDIGSSGNSIGLSSSTMSSDSLELSDGIKVANGFQRNNACLSPAVGVAGQTKSSSTPNSRFSESGNELSKGSEETEQTGVSNRAKQMGLTQSIGPTSENSDCNMSVQAALQGKPQRSEVPIRKKVNQEGLLERDLESESDDSNAEINQFQSSVLEEHEDSDWTGVEELFRTGERTEVELISCSSKGFVVSFGSLVGFLPYRNLGARWKFLAFESWLRKKGLDPVLYKQNLSILESCEVQNKNLALDSNPSRENNQKGAEIIAPDLKVEDLLRIYDQEKMKFLSSFVGQRIKVSVVLADRNSRRLIFSQKSKEKEELVEKKRSLMARLSVGDVVKCTIKKITYFGIFVELEGVPALIHQSEVSWDATLDPLSYFKLGQIVEAKVHQLDFALERIALSLKQITPDPLLEALESLESVVGDHKSLDGRMETTQADIEWEDVESLIKELQKIEGIDRVSKGPFFLSPGLAPTFQVYMASVFQNQYKLLARSGNRVQEVIVQSFLDKEQMKAAIQMCTNRVE